MSNVLGWNKIFILRIAEAKTEDEAKTNANKLPLSSSTVFHTTRMVKAPNSAGKNLTQNTPLPKKLMIHDIHDVTGGTEI